MINFREAKVLLGNKFVGLLQQIASDEYRFTYDATYLTEENTIPISWSLPLQKSPFVTDTLHPYFDNLLMEGHLLRTAEKKYNLSRNSVSDRFKLLLLLGRDLVGAISIVSENETSGSIKKSFLNDDAFELYALKPAYSNACPVCLQKGDAHLKCLRAMWGGKKEIFIRALKENPKQTFKVIVPGVSISGAQIKQLFFLKKNILMFNDFTNYIVKPEGDYSEMPANEHLTMSIAREVGFNTPPCALYQHTDFGLLYIIMRFDRQKNTKCLVEDYAQISGCLEEEKNYSSLESLAQFIYQTTSSPKIEFVDFFRRLLFCFLTGNGDMHLKNWSLMYNSQTQLYKLSPIYDFLNVRASMPEETVETVLTLSSKQTKLTRKDFQTFAEDTLKLERKIIELQFADIHKWIKIIPQFCDRSCLSEKMQKRYMEIVNERYEALNLS